LYNPQLVFVHLQKMIFSGATQMPHIEEANAVHSATALSTVGETGAVTVQDLIDMLSPATNVAAHVLPELSYIELMQEGRSKDMTWTLLYYLGIVTFHDKRDHLRVPNLAMKHLIRGRISGYLRGDPAFSARMLKSYSDFVDGKTILFVEVLEHFFKQRATRSLADTTESSLELAIELLWFEEAQCVPQMHLVADPSKPWAAGKNAFVDIFLGNSRRSHHVANSVFVMEPKNVSLRSLWKARQPKPDAEPTSNNAYERILKELRNATEAQLLSLKHSFYDKVKKRWCTIQVADTLKSATDQLGDYITIISFGRGDSTRRGVSDERVSCRDGGRDILRGYVAICVGGTRVICKSTAVKATQYSYEVLVRP